MEVPYYSQYAEGIPEDWRIRSCGIVALRMAIEATTSARLGMGGTGSWGLVEEGRALGAYKEGVGWIHSGLIRLAQKYGATASYRMEFRSWFWRSFYFLSQRFLKRALDKGQVPIVSVTVPGKNDTHLVPLVGYDAVGFLYHEPAASTETEGKWQRMTYRDFKNRWRRLALFIAS